METLIDTQPLEDARAVLLSLVNGGWSVGDIDGLVRLSIQDRSVPIGSSSWDLPIQLSKAAIRVSARATHRGATIELGVVNDIWEITEIPSDEPDQLFEDEYLEDAKSVWRRETEPLQRLPLLWDVEVLLDLAMLLPACGAGDLRVFWDKQTIEELFADADISTISRLLPGSGMRTYLAANGSASELVFGRVAFTTLDNASSSGLRFHPAAPALAGEPGFSSIPLPSALSVQSGSTTNWPRTNHSLAAAAAAATWALLASSWSHPVVTYFGYKTVAFNLPSVWTSEGIANALSLHRWAFSEQSVDRSLAFRQIVSLYTEDPFAHVQEIIASADVIYAGLRSEAVVQAVQESREVEAQLQAAVLQSARSSTELVKSTAERVLAGLVAVGAAGIANVTQVLDAGVTNVILLFVAGYFLVGLCLFFLVDHRAVGIPMNEITSTISRRSSYLSPEQLSAIAESPSVDGANSLIRTVRVVIPIIYSAIIVSIVVVVCVRQV